MSYEEKQTFTRLAGRDATEAAERYEQARKIAHTHPYEAWKILELAELTANMACSLAEESGTETALRHRDRAEQTRIDIRNLQREIGADPRAALEYDLLTQLALARFGTTYSSFKIDDPRREAMRDEVRWALPVVLETASLAFQQALSAARDEVRDPYCAIDIDEVVNPYQDPA